MAIYTKNEVAELLNIPPDNTSNIKRKLKSMGYEYKCSGKGDTYLIEILNEPENNTLTDFVKNNFGLRIRREADFAHFLHFVLLSPEEDKVPCWSYRSIEANTYYNFLSVKKYLEALKNSGLLITYPSTSFYYATKYDYGEVYNAEGDYKKHLLTKGISKDEWQYAYESYFNVYNKLMEGLDKNPNLVEEMVIDEANRHKKAALDGWWACQLSNEIVVVNKNWEHLPQLLSLLDDFNYEPYEKMVDGNYFEDEKKQEEKEKRIEKALKEKKNSLAEKAINVIPEDKVFTSEDEYMDYLKESGIWKELNVLLKNDDKEKKKEMEERWNRQFYN